MCMYDYQARFYDPRTGMFSSLDPARQYVNPYAYVKWNPAGIHGSDGDADGARGRE